jgi:hypothetical protein
MGFRRVAPDLVDQHLKAECFRAGDDRIEIGERAVARINRAIIGDVVTAVRHRRAIERGDPDRIDPERGDVIEARQQAREIADAVSVAIAKALEINLVDNRAPPPFGLAHPRASLP